MRIVVAGGTGFLGRPLTARLVRDGHDVIVLSRGGAPAPEDEVWTSPGGLRRVRWRGDASTTGWRHVVDGADAVVNLAGESIAGRRWTAAQKERLERSRIDTTRAIVEAIESASRRPALLINGSAVGYYGSRGDEVLSETATPGDDFLATLTCAWERTAQQAESRETRVVLLRSGLVLAREGGALAKMLLPFRLGLGGPIGSGRQYLAWIHRSDWMELACWTLSHDTRGPLNAVAPEPVTNEAFTRALAAALRRPAVLRVPAFALRVALGEMAGPLLLASQRVVPERALAEGFDFRYRTVESALADILTS